MREVDYEMIERILPKGFFVLYISPDGELRYSASNPEDDSRINEIIETFEETQNEEE